MQDHRINGFSFLREIQCTFCFYMGRDLKGGEGVDIYLILGIFSSTAFNLWSRVALDFSIYPIRQNQNTDGDLHVGDGCEI